MGKGKKEEGVKTKISPVKESNMKWRKCHRTVKSNLYLWRKRMDMALVATRGLGIVEYKDSSISSKWKAMNNYGVSKDGLFMQRSNFTIWYNDKRKIPLQRQSMDVLRKFWEEYNTSKNTDDKELVTQMASYGLDSGESGGKGGDIKIKYIASPYIMTLRRCTICYVRGVKYGC